MNEVLRYLSEEMSDDEAEAFEARLFDDDALALDARRVVEVRAGLRARAALGPLLPVIDARALASLRATRKLSEHHPQDGVIDVAFADEAFVIAHVPVDLADARTIDVAFCSTDGAPYFRAHDVPFAETGVIVACEAHVARAAGTLRVRITDETGRLRVEVVLTGH